ncbi:glycosyltransferase [Candidatus Daviesbacteria bacterium]|nr:glycosyltransferase [Candidatus Daviesbacteria bacterium]
MTKPRLKLPVISSKVSSKALLVLNSILALIYGFWWLDPSHIGHPLFYFSLFFGEVYHLFMAFTFWQTIWPQDYNPLLEKDQNAWESNPKVDIYITVAGEQVEVVKKTVLAAKDLKYDKFSIYILNDGFIAKKDNWKQIENLASDLGVFCITRKSGSGAKAGNINNALKNTKGEIVVILDADMMVHEDFLEKTIPYFGDPKVGFVQTPQYYKNYNKNIIAKTAWEQQEFFFGPIMEGKGRQNSAIISGTNVAIRRKALDEAGGMCEDNIAEDFLTSLFIYQKGWKAFYTKEVLAEGLAPQDLLSYYKQQHRWARGSLEVLFAHNPLFKKRLSWRQKIQYLSSAAYYFNGVVVLIDLLIPIIFLYTGISPVAATTTSFTLVFIPLILLIFLTIFKVSDGSLTFRAIAFSHSSFTLQLSALKSLLFREKTMFVVTSKKAQEGNFLFLAIPHIFFVILSVIGVFIALYRDGLTPSVATNVSWAFFNIVMFMPFISVAYNWRGLFKLFAADRPASVAS